MLYRYRRHLKTCQHRAKGRAYLKCNCPVWVDGELHAKRYHRSLKTRDWQRAQKRIDLVESPEAPDFKPVEQATAAWLAQLQIADGTAKKYTRLAHQLGAFCKQEGIQAVAELVPEALARFRASRTGRPEAPIARTTSNKELSTLRQFCAFCRECGWTNTNAAAKLALHKEKPPEVQPYTSEQFTAMLAACRRVGRGAPVEGYEERRARGLLLLLRFTALRISDAMKLPRSSVQWNADLEAWQVRLFTRKTGGHVMLPIPNEVKAALDVLPLPLRSDGKQADNGYYFWNGETKPDAMRGVAWKLLKSVFRLAKVPDGKPHRFRHTLATDILAKGGTMADVADVLGISENIARKYYAKWSPARQERISRVMKSVFSATPLLHAEKPSLPS